MTSPSPLDPAAAIAELGRIKLGEANLDEVLTRVAELAKRALPGASEVSVTLVRGDHAQTAAFTGPLAVDLDEWQYEQGHGPCLQAATTSISTQSVHDTAADTRWPDWSSRAARAGAGSSLSIGLPVQEDVTGALNIYSVDKNAFDADAIVLAERFAGYAAVALANAHMYDKTATLAQRMQAAMRSRAVIEQAKGVIMVQRRCTPEQAFALLRRISQNSNRKLRDVAAAIVAEAHETP